MDININRNLYRRRQWRNKISIVFAFFMAAFGLFWLFWILYTLFARGFSTLSLAVFTVATPPPGGEGGLANAIIGSLILTAVATLIATPLGILALPYLSEYGRKSRFSFVVGFINDILISAPSIVIGLFIYAIYVVNVGHFSGWAGSFALALIMLPVIVRTTEDMLRLVPDSLREAAFALGAPQWKVVIFIVYRGVTAGIMTGVLLGVSRISGESAPLLFTALNNQFWSTNMNAPMANLPIVIFQFAMSPYENWQNLAWAAALLITLFVLSLDILARFALQSRSSHH
jgi:phosphate transport system permease protein